MAHSMVIVGGITIHNFLHRGEDITTKVTSTGQRQFDTRSQSMMMGGDIILKMSDDRKTKTVHKILRVSKRGGPHVWTGIMEDVILMDKMTLYIKAAIAAADPELPSGESRRRAR